MTAYEKTPDTWPAGRRVRCFLMGFPTHFKACFGGDWINPIATPSTVCQKFVAAAFQRLNCVDARHIQPVHPRLPQ